MPKFTTEGFSLNYIDVNPDALNTLVFIHGNSHTLNTFKNQINASEFNNYRLLFLDLPGHGDSDRLPRYTLPIMADILTHFLKSLKLQNVILIGHSLGGHVAINMLSTLNPKGIFLFGTPPLDNPFNPQAFLVNANAKALHLNDPNDEEISTLLLEMNYQDLCINEHFDDFKKTDTRFRTEILEDLITNQHLNEVKTLTTYAGQVSILLARKDSLVNNNYIEDIIDPKRIGIDTIEAGHSPHVEMYSEFNKILFKFIRKVF